MISGTPYLTAVRSEQNVALVEEFKRQAAYYNHVDPATQVQHFYDLTWPVEEAQEIDRIIENHDICFADSNGGTFLAPVAADTPNGKRGTKKQRVAVVKTETPEAPVTAASLVPVLGVDARFMSDRHKLEAYETTNKALGESIRNGDWHIPLQEDIFKLQVCRLMEMESRARAALAVASETESAAATTLASGIE